MGKVRDGHTGEFVRLSFKVKYITFFHIPLSNSVLWLHPRAKEAGKCSLALCSGKR